MAKRQARRSRHPDEIPGWENMPVERVYYAFIRRERERHGAAQSTYDAALWELREYGADRLSHPECQRRLGELSLDQLRELGNALTRLKDRYPSITEQLLDALAGLYGRRTN